MSELDSLSIFRLIDSVLSAEVNYSAVNARLSYTSRVTSAGRDLSVRQFGFAPGLSYYHHSGLFGDLSGYWNSEFDPSYGLTVFSAGYLGIPADWLSYNVSFERSAYHTSRGDSIITAPPNGLNGTWFFDIKKLTLTLDYTYLFGNADAHRIQLGTSGNFEFKDIWIFDKITFFPAANLLFGDQELLYYRFGLDLTDARVRRLIRRFPRLRRRLLTLESENVFGLMNISLSAPVSIKYGNLSLMLAYTYNIPVKLPGELIDTTPNGYFGTSLSYMIPLRSTK